MRASAASSNAGFGGTLTKHTLQTVNLHKILNSVHESGRLKVWPILLTRPILKPEKTECARLTHGNKTRQGIDNQKSLQRRYNMDSYVSGKDESNLRCDWLLEQRERN